MNFIYNHNQNVEPFKFGRQADNALATLKNLNQVITALNSAEGGMYTAGTTLSTNKVVMVLNGTAVNNDPTTDLNIGKQLGFTLSSAGIGTPVQVKFTGIITLQYWGLVQDAVYYAAPNGNITNVIPTGPGIFQRVGVAIDSDTLKIDFSEPLSII